METSVYNLNRTNFYLYLKKFIYFPLNLFIAFSYYFYFEQCYIVIYFYYEDISTISLLVLALKERNFMLSP